MPTNSETEHDRADGSPDLAEQAHPSREGAHGKRDDNRIVTREQEIQEADLQQAAPELRIGKDVHVRWAPLGYVSWRAPAPNARARTRRQYGVMIGSAKKKSATALMTPEIGRVNRIASEPCDMIRLWRSALLGQVAQDEGKHERSDEGSRVF